MDRPFYVIDAFAGEPMGGNAAAVVLDPRGLNEEQMQQIAAEFNLSETTFVLPPLEPPPQTVQPGQTDAEQSDHELTVRFRWFTPTMKVDMCGHATIAGVHALIESGRLARPTTDQTSTVQIHTRSGWLSAYVESIPTTKDQHMIWLDLIDPVLTPLALQADDFSVPLGLSVEAFDADMPPVKTQDGDVLVFVKDFAALNDAKPDYPALSKLLDANSLRGLSLATLGTLTPSIHVQSRFFAPTCGVNEDPVTGSVHGPLAAYLVQRGKVELHDGLAGLNCTQAIPGGRAGLIHAIVQPQSDGVIAVRIGGKAITTMRGMLTV